MHQFGSLAKYEYGEDEWLCLDSLQGKAAVHTILYNLRHKSARRVRGHVEFQDSFMTVELEEPVYKRDRKTGEWHPAGEWNAYRFNGKYRLEISRNDPLP